MIGSNFIRRMKLLSTCSTFAALLVAPAQAQTPQDQATTAQTPPEPNGVEDGENDIVVTATKRARAQEVQDIPVAISVIGGDAIGQANADDLTEVGSLAPNVQLAQVGTFAGFSNFVIRGVGINTSTRTVDPAVGLFLNGVFVGFGGNAVQQSFDIASVEILRGPQGTLFGRNVTGGAVLVTTRRPGTEFAGNAQVGIGSFNRIDVEAAVDIPIAKDVLTARLAFLSKSRDGYYTNLDNGQSEGDSNVAIFRPTIVFIPNEDLTITLIGEYLRDKSDSPATRNIIDTIRPKLAQTLAGYTPPPGRYDVRHNLDGYLDSEVYSITGEIAYEVGPGAITSVTGYRDIKFDTSTDFDGTPFPLFEFPDNKEGQNQFSQELRYAAQLSDAFDFVVGANYYHANLTVGERRRVLTTSNTAGKTYQRHTSWGAFGEATYNLTQQLGLTVGGRFTWEKKTIAFSPVGRCTLDFATCTTTFNGEADGNDFSPRVALNYKITPDALVYASYSRGYRSPTFNNRAQRLETLGPVRAENVSAYEVGAKTEWLDGRLRANLTGFYTRYNDQQIFVNSAFAPPGLPPTSEQVLTNASGSEIWGFEGELIAQLTDEVRLEGNIGYVKPQYDAFDFSSTFGVDVNFDGAINATDAALATDLRFARVPELEYNLAGIYELPVGANTVRARVDYAWTGEQFFNFANTQQSFLGSYGLLNASLAFIVAEPQIQISAFVKNIADQDYVDYREEVGTVFLGEWGGQPRTWGIEASYKF